MFVLGKVANKQIFSIIRQGDNREKREERIRVAEIQSVWLQSLCSYPVYHIACLVV